MLADFWRVTRPLILFYKKLLLPSLSVSVAIGSLNYAITQHFSTAFIASFYPLISLLFQYGIYETQTPNEYYLYHNLGFSKSNLWVCNLAISLVIALLIALI
ncbi:MAG: hypothetical protein ACJAWV_002509 [Flammeovirgaceae bacterium]|jgi:hypothetical protein